MNKAFTKEDDESPPLPSAERAISSAPNFVTPRGAKLIKTKIDDCEKKLALEVERPVKSELKRQLRYWRSRQSSMQIVEPGAATTSVNFGNRVTVRRGSNVSTFEIVGEDEADPQSGSIAWTAPLARAILGAKVGETLDLESGRNETVTILDISRG